MIPNITQHVKCFLRNSMVVEGSIIEWNDLQVVLQSLDDKSILIIHQPIHEILLTKIIISEQDIQEELPLPSEKPKKRQLSDLQQQVKQKLYEVQTAADDTNLNKKNLTELRELVLEQDKQIIIQKKREHFGSFSAPKTIKYASQSAYIPIKLPTKPTSISDNKSPFKPGRIPNGHT